MVFIFFCIKKIEKIYIIKNNILKLKINGDEKSQWCVLIKYYFYLFNEKRKKKNNKRSAYNTAH